MIEERIVVVPNQNSLAVSLAYKGKGLFDTRIFTPVDLAREALLRSGKTCDKQLISSDDEIAYYKLILENNKYFSSTKLSDIKKVAEAIRILRNISPENEYENIKSNLAKGFFKEKNSQLFEVYSKYIESLDKNNQIDNIGLIRYAIANAEKVYTRIITLKEYPLQPLEKKLIDAISECEEKSLLELYEVDEEKIHIESYKNCYGCSNEVATIIDDIYANKNNDRCVVACADYNTYSQAFYDYACKYKLNITFGDGISLINSNPGKMLNQYYHWMTDGNFGWKPFMQLIHSPFFDFEKLNSLVKFDIEERLDVPRFWQRVSKLRLTNDKATNTCRVDDFEKAISDEINDNCKLRKYLPSIKAFAAEFSLPINEFIEKYTIIRDYNEKTSFYKSLDMSALNEIKKEINSLVHMNEKLDDDAIESILKRNIFRQGNMPGHLHICSIQNALSSLRDSLYICGLSSSAYPGSPKEDYLILDKDLDDFGNKDLSSEGKITAKKNLLFNLVTLACSLKNKVFLSYPGLNVSELKNNNASSLLFELYKREYGADKSLKDFSEHVIKVGYFEPKLSASKDVGNSYNDGNTISFSKCISENSNIVPISLTKYSPSALNTFFDCRKKFYFQNILKISAPDDYFPYETIPANEQGTLVHSLMEYLADNNPNLDDFIAYGSKAFDEYMKITVPLVSEEVSRTKDQFIEMLTNGWYMDNENKREMAFKEEDKETLHDESGVMIHGFPDRVEYTKDHKAVIIDFKTETKLDKHKPDDVDTCLQVLIYAYIVEKEMNLEIDHCEYRMLRFRDGIITCKYDDEMKKKLTEKLKEFKEAVDNADYGIKPMTETEAKSKCSYCKYASICGREVIKDE